MAQRKLYFIVGLFVIVGVLIGASALVWLGASKYFQKGSLYVTYFDESVQGLQADSIVKYRGVSVGTVKEISVAPDQRLVEILMKIDVKDFSVDGVVARLTMAGITGIVYVELDRKSPGDISLLPKSFKSPYPVIPSSPSGIKKIETGINEILKNIRQVDFKGISDQVIGTAKTIDLFISGKEMKRIVGNIDAAAVKLALASEKVNEIVADGSIKGVVADTRSAVNEARVVINQVKGEVEGLKVGQTMGRVNQFVDGTSRQVQSTLADMQDTSDRLRRVSDSLDALVESLKASPSQLLFSSPPKGE